MENEHIHTGFVAFVTIGIYATLWFWLMRFLAAKLALNPATEPIGAAIGAISGGVTGHTGG